MSRSFVAAPRPGADFYRGFAIALVASAFLWALAASLVLLLLA